MFVWRVEKDGRGPYVRGFGVVDSSGTNPHTPSPSCDGISYKTLTIIHYFGFASIKQMKEWFDPKDRVNLDTAGFILSKWKLDDCDDNIIHGGKQVCFKRGIATHVETKGLLTC